MRGFFRKDKPAQPVSNGFNPPTQGSEVILPAYTSVQVSSAALTAGPLNRGISAGSHGTYNSSSGERFPRTPLQLFPQTPSPGAAYPTLTFSRVMNPNASVGPLYQQTVAPATGTTTVPATSIAPMMAPGVLGSPQMVFVQMPMHPGAAMQPMTAIPTAAGAAAAQPVGMPMQAVMMPQSMALPMQPGMVPGMAGAFPSKGSALHGTGKCSPCAWFWKKGRGCQAGINCEYCHLCPEGELKARKKVKQSLIRRGAF